MNKIIEYRIRPVTRYVITRFEGDAGLDGELLPTGACGSSTYGEFDNLRVAEEVGQALWGKERGARWLGLEPRM